MKRRIRLGIIVALIAVMMITITQLRNEGDEPSDDGVSSPPGDRTDRVALFDTPRGDIARITVTTDESTVTIARMDGELFAPVYEHDVPFNGQLVNRIVSGGVSLQSRRVIGEVDNRSEFGFDDPVATVTVERWDDTGQELIVGDRTPARDAYYVMRPDDPRIYSVVHTSIDPFLVTLDELRDRTVPTIAMERLRRVVVETVADRTVRIERKPDIDSDPELGSSLFIVTEPFGRPLQADTHWLQDLTTYLGALRIGRYVDDAPTSFARYGLASPEARILVEDGETTLELLVGFETEGGRFARFPDRPTVFVLSGTEPIVTTRPDETVSAFVLIINIDRIDTVIVESAGETFIGEIKRAPTAGEDEREETYLLNGREIDEDLFKELYQWAIGLQFDAEAPPGAIPTGSPVATVTYFLNDGSEPRSASFTPHNTNAVFVVRDGRGEFIMSIGKIRRMLAAFRAAAADR